VARTGAFGGYGQTGGRMSLEDDEWSTAPRTWAALAPHLAKFHASKAGPHKHSPATSQDPVRRKKRGFKCVG
jgi:hypothetical protein